MFSADVAMSLLYGPTHALQANLKHVFTARRYASAICAVLVRLSVRLSVRQSDKSRVLYQNS